MFKDQQYLSKALASKKYAEDLLGPNRRDQYDTQRDVAQDLYRTNFDTIQNTFLNLKEKLEAQRERSNRAYREGLGEVAEGSFDRMNAQTANLVQRGLTNSGIGNRLEQADTTAKGEAVNRLLSALGGTVTGHTEALKEGGDRVTAGERGLNEELSKALGDIGGQDLANQRAYAQTIAGLAQGKEARDAQNQLAEARLAAQRAASGSGKKSKEQKELEEMYKRQAVMAILNDIDLETGEQLGWTDQQKANALRVMFDLDGPNVVESYNTALENVTVPQKLSDRQQTLQKKLATLQEPLSNVYKASPAQGYDPMAVRISDSQVRNQKSLEKTLENINKEIEELSLKDRGTHLDKLAELLAGLK